VTTAQLLNSSTPQLPDAPRYGPVRLPNVLQGKAALITGGTKGLGLAIGLAFGREGARVYLTHKWGSADLDAVRRRFAEAGAPEPRVLDADASSDEDTAAVLQAIRKEQDAIEVFVSNVSFAQVITGLDMYKKRSFLSSLSYSAWPMIGTMQKIREVFGRYPRYVLATSCDGAETYYPGYDFVAAAKTVMETFCKYLTTHLFGQDVRINVLRSRPVSTESLVATFGEGFEPFLRRYHGDGYFISLDEVGDAALALCSGLLDAVSGQVILLDRGVAFSDNLMRLYEQRERRGLPLAADAARTTEKSGGKGDGDQG